ncbi:MAG TPA: sigma-70 family RNA polymerase sigma factor [Chthoniobacterales bacterium]|jgi:RNA polymerase sigma-70 factor (ECF subfamily)
MISPDSETIAAALAGDRSAFEELIRANAMRVYAVAFAVLQEREEAEDVAQETFLRAFRDRRQLREPERFVAWLSTIARNLSRDRLRKKRHATLPEENFPEARDESIPTPDGALAAAEQSREMHAALATLPERHRTALTLRYLEGLDYRAIAEAMDLTDGALRGVLGRALATMRDRLRMFHLPEKGERP